MELTASGDFRRGGSVVLSDGRTGHVVGYDGPDFVKVEIAGSGAASRPIVKARRTGQKEN